MLAIVLAGPISGDREYKDGELMEMIQGDFDQLSKWSIVRAATDAEIAAVNPPIKVASSQAIGEGKPADPLGSAETEAPKETAAQKKKREADEANAAKQLADQEAARAKELADKEAAEKLANQTKEPTT
jgi:hypothetical protein